MPITSQSGRHRGFTLVELLVVIAVIGTLASLMLPAVNAARESGRRTQCSNNVKQLALALHNYHEAHRKLPQSNSEGNASGAPAHGWIAYILPQLELPQLYDRYHFEVNWDDPANRQVVERELQVVLCPSTSEPERRDASGGPGQAGFAAIADYASISYVDRRLEDLGLAEASGNGAMPKNAAPSLAQVLDGLSNTLLIIESAGRPQVFRGRSRFESPATAGVNGAAWARPALDFALVGSTSDGASAPGPCPLQCTNGIPFTQFPDPVYGTEGSGQPYSFHPHGVNSAFADGSVHFLTADVDLRMLANLVTRSGHEMPPRLD